MLPRLTRKLIADGRRVLVVWSVAVALFSLIYMSSFSNFKNDIEQARDAQDRFPGAIASFIGGVADMSVGAGYLQTVVFRFFIPLLVIACAVTWGARVVATPEESGSLDLLLSLPLTRRKFLLERMLAMAIAVTVVSVVVWSITLFMNARLDMGVGFAAVTATCLGLYLVGLCFGTLAITISAFVGHRAFVLGATAGVAFSTYLLRSLAVENDAIKPLRWLSPFHYYLGNDPLFNGFAVGYLLVLAALVALLALLAVVAFVRRDIAT
jgi:ABC-2 type transport system permease protein